MFLLVLEWRGERCELDEWKILLNISPITICSLCILKNLPANVGDIRDAGLIHGSGRSPGGEHGNPLQYACLENPMERGTWPAIVHRVTKSWTQMKQLSMHAYPAIWITEQSVPFTSFTMVISLSKVLADRIDMSKSDVCNFLKHRHYLKWVTWPPFRFPLPWVPVSNTWRRVKCQGMEEQ